MSTPNPVTSYNFELAAAALSGSGSPSPAIVVVARDPTTTDLSGPSGNYAIGQLWYSTASQTYFGLLSVSAGSSNWGALGTATAVTVPNGGTGAATFTTHGVLVGEGTSAIQATAAGTNGQLLIGSTGANPAFATVTSTLGLSFTTGAASLAINVSKDGFAVSPVAGTSQAMVAQTCYVANNAGATTFTLPATAAVGDTFKVVGGSANAAGWVIQANGGQTIYQGAGASTSGGTASSGAHPAESIELMCTAANTDFVIVYANDTVVLA